MKIIIEKLKGDKYNFIGIVLKGFLGEVWLYKWAGKGGRKNVFVSENWGLEIDFKKWGESSKYLKIKHVIVTKGSLNFWFAILFVYIF